ncbi:hypothetical protein EKO27_g5203 [Xylaria grammica]|uniref:FAD-binding PCMH-type domain-containing protein n=1 Tax=Xylaria grammica TaxID=363999 RepID=A0A439D670_9PEZI|nr:hypothetical protein EKO27_g5203 [Xylaria grammica]
MASYQEDVAFKTLDGLTLRGTLYPGSNRGPGIIMTPGFNLTRETLLPKVAQYFQNEGITALVYDPRSVGSSDGFPRNNINPTQQTTDYHDALTYLKSDKRVDSSRIAFWGFSFSGTVALAAAALDTRAQLVLAVCPLTIWELPDTKYRGVLSKAMQDRESQLAGNKPFSIPMITEKGENPVGFGIGMGRAEMDLVRQSKEKLPNLEINTSIQTYYNIIAWSPFKALRILPPTPMLIVTPENDRISSMQQQKELIFDKAEGPKQMHIVWVKADTDVAAWPLDLAVPIQTEEESMQRTFFVVYKSFLGNNNVKAEATHCKNIPGDLHWPSHSEWARLNSTVHGRLIAATPIASVCHDPYFDDDACMALKTTWPFVDPHLQSPVDIVAPYFQNQTCDPFKPRHTRCTLGNYASYSINVSSIEDIKAGIRFANTKNVRLTVKNTGHDLLGKSTGAGALSLWMHNLKAIQFFDECHHGSKYAGPCVKLGAGVIFDEVIAAADARGLRLTVGSCPTVGISGGFTTGGGHGVFASTYGLGADNVLEWEVITADGRHLLANAKKNADLYWALSGGGPGTFAVVVSVTMRTYPDEPMSAASVSFSNLTLGSDEKFWHAVTTFHMSLPPVVSAGATVSFLIAPTSLTAFNIAIPSSNATEVDSILKGITVKMAEIGVATNITATTHSGFLDMYNTYIRQAATNTPAAQIAGGRLIPRGIIKDAQKSTDVTRAFRSAVEEGFNLLCVALDASKPPLYDNSVFPPWRSSLMTCLIQVSWDFNKPRTDMLALQEQLTQSIMPQIEAVTPGGGVYLNEASFQQLDWQESFYGSNYPRLEAIKAKYDPQTLLYAVTAVGSEYWAADPDGRLCRTSTRS